MDIALVTGADSALGLALVERLLRQGFRVHGLGNNFSAVALSHPEFRTHAVDLTDVDSLHRCVESILETDGAVHQLVHAIDVSPGTPFHQQTVGGVEGVLRIGLTGPVMITRLVLPNLIRFRGGLVFVLSSGKLGFHSNATCGLIEGGLRRFASELLMAHRDGGLKVSTVLLQHNEELPSADADRRAAKQTRVDLLDVADLIERIVAEGAPNHVGEMSIYPRTGAKAEPLPDAAAPIDPYREIRLPPKEKRPEEKTPIPTEKPVRPQRVLGISDEELEERIAEVMEEYSNHPERFDPAFEPNQERGRRQDRQDRDGDREHRREPVERQREDDGSDDEGEESTSSAPDAAGDDRGGGGDQRKKRKRNRNRKRNRDRDRGREGSPDEPDAAAGARSDRGNDRQGRKEATAEAPDRDPQNNARESSPPKESSQPDESAKARNESRGDGSPERKSRPRRRGGRASGERQPNRREGGTAAAADGPRPASNGAEAPEKQPSTNEAGKEGPSVNKEEARVPASGSAGAETAEPAKKTAARAVKKTASKRVARKTVKKTATADKPPSKPKADPPELPLGES